MLPLVAEQIRGDDDVVGACRVGVGKIEMKGVVDDIEDTVDRYHDEHADNTPDHVLFAFGIVAALVELPEKFDETVDEEQKAEGKYDQKHRINDVGHYPLHCVTCGLWHREIVSPGAVRGARNNAGGLFKHATRSCRWYLSEYPAE